MTNENDSGGFSAGMMLGIIVGAAAVLFFQSEKGERVLSDLKSKAQGAINDIESNDLVKAKIQEAQKAVMIAKETIESARTELSDLKEKVVSNDTPRSKQPKRFFSRSAS